MSANMKILSLTGILLVFYAFRSSGVPITYDFTDPLNAIKAGNLSVDEFSKNIKSHFGNLTTPLKLSVAYSQDCNISEDCGPTINEAVMILNDVKRKLLTQKVEIEHYNFRFRIGIGELENLNATNQTKYNIPSGTYDISFFLPEKTTCDDLKNVTWEQYDILVNRLTWFSPESVPNVRNVWFGYNEDLIHCHRMNRYSTNHLHTTYSLGKSSCVVESFTLFKKRMDDLHSRHIRFTIQSAIIDYTSMSHCSGDKYYGHLLENYWERYANSTIGATIPLPVGRFEISSHSVNKIIPYIDAKSCHGDDSYPWYTPVALETLSRYFGAVVLTQVELRELQSNAANIDKNEKPDIRLDLFVDYADWLQYNPENLNFSGRDYNWSVVERELNQLDDAILHPLQNIKVTALIFPVTTSPTAENFTVNVNTGFARRMSSRLGIGCAFNSNSFGTLLNYTSSAVVAACKQVNGSIYTLQNHFKLKSITKVNKETIHHFEYVVRPKLEEMRKFKEEVVDLHPQATVYFQLRIELEMDDNQTTMFCNKEALSLNEYIEAIVNWATFNGNTLIMGRAFDDNCKSKYQTWFSVLRPMEESSYYINPRFVLRNSPKILADTEVEPCLEWTGQDRCLDRPTVNESYFHNNYLGSSFITLDMRKEKLITRLEYEILLQFTFHRFDLVILYVKSDTYTHFITAINTLASDGIIAPTKNIFIFYLDPRDDVDAEKKLQDFYGFLDFTKLTLRSNISLLKAIFYNYDTNWKRNNLNSKLHYNMMVIESARSSNLDVGIELETTECQNLLVNAISQKHILKEPDNLLRSAKYLLCWKYVDLEAYDNPKSLGMLFDVHFYVKKVYQEFYPHLDVYFQIFVQVVLSETTMTDYLILLSHFEKFATAYNLSYLIVDSFDREYLLNGWWKISNYSNLSLPSIYEERYSASVGFKTWVPTPQANKADDNKLNILLGVTTAGFVLMIVVSGFLLWYYKNKLLQYLSNEEVQEFYNGKEGAGEEQTAGDYQYCKFDKKFELAFADVFIDPKDLLGRGNFGTVYKGLVKDEPVAIKRPNDNCPATSFKSVLCEVKLLCYIGTHNNVIQFVGAYTKEIRKGVLYIATEFCSNGSLDGLLRNKKRVVSNTGDANNETIGTTEEDAVYSHDLHRFAKEIASGMDYIADKNVIHGDLSARNVLLDENFTCKIGDFGLSRKMYEYLEYVKQSQEPLPWKWMAYESLESMHFTTKSDVWSYGVTIWEIYSLGKVPYGGLSWTAGFAEDLKNGLRLLKPEYATDEIYKAMLRCWELEADARPTFTDMVDFFKELSYSQYIVLEI